MIRLIDTAPAWAAGGSLGLGSDHVHCCPGPAPTALATAAAAMVDPANADTNLGYSEG